jgi:ABC-type bacteriocin/lantibiotic exporter with double-glycine peptidase domain
LENGIETRVGEHGNAMSGGQRQRLSIARALYNDPQIIIMDEATSALDNETESAVMESIEEMRGDITIIIVAHRLTTLKCCDIIYEVKDGIAVIRDKEEVIHF